MKKPAIDPGLGEKYFNRTQRALNRDGSFNVARKNSSFNPGDMYQFLVSISWPKFFLIIFSGYLLVNTAFALLFVIADPYAIRGTEGEVGVRLFFHVFFFSTQTFTTVGYGGMTPKGIIPNIIASAEAMIGLLAFAIATGLLYGRFSRPSARIKYSENALITPGNGKPALHFRIANLRKTSLMEMEATLMAIAVEESGGTLIRRYYELKLERDSIYLFPLNWTIVHPIDEESIFYGKSEADIRAMELELMVMVKGFDETFGQTVHSRGSYRFNEIIWGARFLRPYYTDDSGQVVFDIAHLNDHERVALEGSIIP